MNLARGALPALVGVAACLGVLWPGEIHPVAALVILPLTAMVACAHLVLAPLRSGALGASAIAFCCGQLMASLVSAERDVTRQALGLSITGAVALLVGTTLTGRGLRLATAGLLLAVGATAACRGIAQKVWGLAELRRHVLSDPNLGESERELYLARVDLGRPWGPFSLPGLFGGFLAAVAILGTAAACDRKLVLPARIGAAGTAMLAAIGMVLARSPASVACPSLALAALALSRPWRGRTKIPLAVGIAVLGIAAVGLGVRRAATDQDRRGSLQMRLANWEAAVRIWRAAPVLGEGPGTFGLHYPRHAPPGANNTRHAHSVLGRLMAESGALGVLAAAWLAMAAGAGVLRALAVTTGTDLGWALAATCLVAHALVDIDMDVESLGLLTPFVVGAAIAGGSVPGRHVTGDRLIRGILALLVCGAGWAYVAQARGRVLVDRASVLARLGDRRGAVDGLARAVDADPRSGTARLLLGSELLARGDTPEAIRMLEAARELSPDRGKVREALAVAYGTAGRAEDACREGEAACVRLPRERSARQVRDRLCGAAEPTPRE